MSFTIKTNNASAFAANGLQERHAHDRRTEHRPHHPARHHGALNDSCDLTHSGKAGASIREAGDFQAHLNESLSFLQTQDSALGQIENLFVNSPEHQDFLHIFESLTGEKFNGLDLFSHDTEEQPLYVQTPESAETVCIHRPLMSAESPAASLHEAILAAREENRKEQAKLREISDSTARSHARLEITAPKISNTESAKQTAALSQQRLLADASTALTGQANSAHEAVLRLFA
jgi:flagellin-like hook-associated protein FlgL